MGRIAAIRWLLVAASIAGGALAYYVAARRHVAFPVTSAFTITAVILDIGAIWLFLRGLKGFRTEMRRAYVLLSIGIALFGLAQAQIPVVDWFDWWIWVNSGLGLIPYLLAVVLLFLGVRSFGKLFAIKGWWMSVWRVSLVALAVAALALLLPHVHTQTSTALFDIYIVLSVWDTTFVVFSAVILWHIIKRIGRVYVPPMKMLYAGLVVTAVAGAHYTVVALTLTDGNWYFDESIVVIPFIAGAFLWLWSGYLFNTMHVSSSQDQHSGSQLIDVVVYMGGLASDAAAVDPTLDKVRAITAGLGASGQLSEKDKIALAHVYKDLETYLTTKEPLRLYTKEQLQQTLRHEFVITKEIEGLLFKAH